MDISKRRNCWGNIAVNKLLFSDPYEAGKKQDSLPGEEDEDLGVEVKAVPKGFTVWEF